jgi:hypothetical protein
MRANQFFGVLETAGIGPSLFSVGFSQGFRFLIHHCYIYSLTPACFSSHGCVMFHALAGVAFVQAVDLIKLTASTLEALTSGQFSFF